MNAHPRTIDHVALGIVAVMLGGLYVFFGRLLAGSWRGLSASLVAVAIVLGGAAFIDRVRRRRGVSGTAASTSPWTLVALTLLGAAAGFVYGLVVEGHPVGRAAGIGAIVIGVLVVLDTRRARAATKRVAPDRPAASLALGGSHDSRPND